MTRVLVTGGAGFIGSHYVGSILGEHSDSPTRVTVLDKLTYAGNTRNLAPVRNDPRFSFVQGDVCDAELVDGLVTDHDQIVHFAAETHVDRSLTGASAFVRTNVLGTQTLLDAALRQGVDGFVHVSTDEVYGSVKSGSWAEDSPLRPNSPYAASKAASDLLALSYHRSHGLDVRVTRCSNNYGPRQFPEKVIPLFVLTLLDGGRVPLYGDGGNVRDWLHVDDHVRAVELVRRKGRSGRVYNVGGGAELSNRELTGMILEALHTDWDAVEFVADRKGHDRRYSLNHGRITAELGYRPKRLIGEALADTIGWYRENRGWWESPTRQCERHR